jgi:hypothetical protein
LIYIFQIIKWKNIKYINKNFKKNIYNLSNTYSSFLDTRIPPAPRWSSPSTSATSPVWTRRFLLNLNEYIYFIFDQQAGRFCKRIPLKKFFSQFFLARGLSILKVKKTFYSCLIFDLNPFSRGKNRKKIKKTARKK